jgi:hypothetical protein
MAVCTLPDSSDEQRQPGQFTEMLLGIMHSILNSAGFVDLQNMLVYISVTNANHLFIQVLCSI